MDKSQLRCEWYIWPVLAVSHWPEEGSGSEGWKNNMPPPPKWMDGLFFFPWHKSSDKTIYQVPEHSRWDNNCGLDKELTYFFLQWFKNSMVCFYFMNVCFWPVEGAITCQGLAVIVIREAT